MGKEIRVMLDASDFKELMAGLIITKELIGAEIKIGLIDIGYDYMIDIINNLKTKI